MNGQNEETERSAQDKEICRDCIHREVCNIRSTHKLFSMIVTGCEKFSAVKHGKWLDVRCEVKCSNCGEEYSDEIFLMRGNINYCPNCGAEMKE